MGKRPSRTETLGVSAAEAELEQLVAKNVTAVAELRERIHPTAVGQMRAFATLNRVLSRPGALYTVVLAVVAWVGLNLFLRQLGRTPFDPPPFFWLQGTVAVGALYTSLTVLIAQGRQARIAEHRAELDLQVNLLSEQRTAKLIELFEELRRDLPNVPSREDRHATAMASSVTPGIVSSVVEAKLKRAEEDDPDP